MKMPKVDSFLGCMTLETGGLVIGWFNAICYFFSFLGGAFALVIISLFDCDDLEKALKDQDALDESEMFLCSFGRVFVIVFSVIVIILSIGLIVISYFCIKGTYRRNHIHVKPMMILMGVLTVIAFLDIFSTSYTSLETSLVETVISAYQFIVLYSLYNKFFNEFTNGPMAYFQAPIDKEFTNGPMPYFQAPIEKA